MPTPHQRETQRHESLLPVTFQSVYSLMQKTLKILTCRLGEIIHRECGISWLPGGCHSCLCHVLAHLFAMSPCLGPVAVCSSGLGKREDGEIQTLLHRKGLRMLEFVLEPYHFFTTQAPV